MLFIEYGLYFNQGLLFINLANLRFPEDGIIVVAIGLDKELFDWQKAVYWSIQEGFCFYGGSGCLLCQLLITLLTAFRDFRRKETSDFLSWIRKMRKLVFR